jgi:hypothetical protein
MGGHRGDGIIAKIRSGALMDIFVGLALAGGATYGTLHVANAQRELIENNLKELVKSEAKSGKKFAEWLETQPFDNEDDSDLYDSETLEWKGMEAKLQ